MRLREERARLKLSQTELGDIAGITKNTQMLYESDKRSPKADYLSAVASAGVDIRYVIEGIRLDSMLDQAGAAYRVTDGTPIPATNTPGPGFAEVNLYDVEGAAGAGRSLEQERVEGQIYFPEAQLTSMGISPEQVAGIKVRGDSMETTLADGDWVLVNLGDTDFRQEGVFLLMISGERRIKRVQRLAGGALYLISDNEHYQPEMIRPEQMREVQILGRCEVRIGKIF
ncbi:XRE family transcriptional regulator [Halomonas caseinilytica]|uniref:XRE family transcriptional regulator n=1 Tax=Halomonas caseinilytica TaxID=438744 RepID=UPI0007E55EDB|nr:helix-turn-helix transcriptional regulator [Halomonas caseinilytica]SEM31965.1 Phage repressor protein C, contains Cro/C1-type HTH and peptisase s24 domains [Halomonas caseinilytica]